MDNITNTDSLLADLNKLDINDLLEVIESALTVIDAKTSKYKGLDLIEMMELDDKYQVFKRLNNISDTAHGIGDEVDGECFSLFYNIYEDVFTDDVCDILFEFDTWAEQIDLLEKLRQGKKDKQDK